MADLKNKILTSLTNMSDPKQAGKALLALNVCSTALAAAANTFAAAKDEHTSAEDKKFLVPAGVATGVANVGLYLALTLKVISAMEGKANKVLKGMEKKGTLTDNVKKYAEHTISKEENKKIFKKSAQYISDMKEYLLKNGKPTENAVKEYKDVVKGCASVTGAFIGVIVGYGILSPIIRDVSAYFVQKHVQKKNSENNNLTYKPYFNSMQANTESGNKKQPLNINTYMASTKSNASGLRV